MGDRHIAKVTRGIISQLNIKWTEALAEATILRIPVPKKLIPRVLYRHQRANVLAVLQRMRPETWARIVVQGRALDGSGHATSMYEVHWDTLHCKSYLDKYASGRDLLIEMTITAIIAEMIDQLRDRGH